MSSESFDADGSALPLTYVEPILLILYTSIALAVIIVAACNPAKVKYMTPSDFTYTSRKLSKGTAASSSDDRDKNGKGGNVTWKRSFAGVWIKTERSDFKEVSP
jgi:hypothetical protein